MINKIKKVTRSDWAPTIKNTVYDIAKFSVFFYVEKNMIEILMQVKTF